MGLVNAVVPLAELERETVAWCREMAALSPMAAAPAEGELQRRGGRAHRPAAALPRRDAALLHDRGGPGGPQRLPAGPQAGLLQVPEAAVSAAEDLADGRAAADAARRDRAGAGRHAPPRIYVSEDDCRLGAFVGGAGRQHLHPDRDQPRQRLLGRQARRRHRRPARSGAGDGLGPGRAAPRPGRDLGRLRGSRSPAASTWPPSPGPVILAVGRRLDPRRRPLHGRAPALRLRGPRRAVRLPLLRPRRRQRLLLRAARGARLAAVRALGRRSARWRRRSWSSTTSATSTPTGAPARTRSRSGSAASAPASSIVAADRCCAYLALPVTLAAEDGPWAAMLGALSAPAGARPLRAGARRGPTGRR